MVIARLTDLVPVHTREARLMLQLLSRCEGMLLNRRVVERIAEALPACGVALSIGLGALGLAKGSVRAVCIVTLAVYVAIGITVSKSPTRQGFHDRLAGGTYVVRRRRRRRGHPGAE